MIGRRGVAPNPRWLVHQTQSREHPVVDSGPACWLWPQSHSVADAWSHPAHRVFASEVFDDEHGDVVRAVTIPHECLEEQVGELIRGDMFWRARRGQRPPWAMPMSKGRSRCSTSPSVNMTSCEPMGNGATSAALRVHEWPMIGALAETRGAPVQSWPSANVLIAPKNPSAVSLQVGRRRPRRRAAAVSSSRHASSVASRSSARASSGTSPMATRHPSRPSSIRWEGCRCASRRPGARPRGPRRRRSRRSRRGWPGRTHRHQRRAVPPQVG